jgi:(S)-3,5-dihydroxyphenylglycine transaminase
MTRLNLSDLPNYLDEPVMTSMNFLNEAVGKYPDAISLASGRPHDFFLTEIDIPEALDRYKAYLRDELGLDPAGINRRLYQYGPARGIINEVVARMLRTDEDIVVPAEAIVMTVGCQEAIYLSLQALCHRPGDVAFIADPGYLGLLGAARLLNVKVRVVP